MWWRTPRNCEGRKGIGGGTAEVKQPGKGGGASTSAESTTERETKPGLGTLTGGAAHGTADLGEDLADIIRHTRHDRARRNGDETSHQGVFDQVLAPSVFPGFNVTIN